MAGDHRAGGRADLDRQLAETSANADRLADQLRPGRIAVALEGDHRAAVDRALDLEDRREGLCRQREQRLSVGERAHRSLIAAAGVGARDRPAVEVRLRLDRSRDRGRAPPGAGQVVDPALDHALALRALGGADRHRDPVVLGELGGFRSQPIGAWVDECRHPVGAPGVGGAAEAAQQPIEGGGQMGEAHRLAEDAADPARVAERADEHVGGTPPGSLPQLKPVELQLCTGVVAKLDRGVGAGAAAGAGGPQAELSELADQGRIGAIEAERGELGEQHGRKDVGVVGEAGLEVGTVRLNRAGCGAPFRLEARQVAADRLWVAAAVAGDCGDRPAAVA